MTAGPTVTVRIDFDSVAFISTPTWTDVSADVMRLSIGRGKNYEMNRMETGTAQVQLLNTSGDYWPNTAGTYTGKILPMKKIQIQATWNSITYNVFTGYIESWQPDFIQDPDKVPVMNLTCVDAIKYLSRYSLNTAGYAEELSGTRINNILDDLGWPESAVGKDSYSGTFSNKAYVYGVNWEAQTFTASDDYALGSIKLYLSKVGATPQNVIASIRATDGSGLPTGNDLTVGIINSGIIIADPSYYYYEFTFDPIDLSNGTKYAVVLRMPEGTAGPANHTEWAYHTPSGYATGSRIYSSDSGSSWTEDTTKDFFFTTYTATSRMMDTGQSNIIASGALADANALEHIYNVLESEDGNLFVDVNGLITFQDRAYRQATKSSAGTVGDQAGDIFWNSIDISLDDYYVNNDVRITRTGGTQQIQQDSTSINTYGLRTLSKTGLLLTDDTNCNYAAQHYLNRYKDAIQRVKSIILNPSTDSGYALALGNDISTYFQLRVTQAGILNYYYVDGITHRWDARESLWETQWELSDADLYQNNIFLHSVIRPDNTINYTGSAAAGDFNANVSDSNYSTFMYIWDNGNINFSLSNVTSPKAITNINSINFVWAVSGGFANDNINTWITVNSHDYAVHNMSVPGNTNVNFFYYEFVNNPNSSAAWNLSEVNAVTMGFKHATAYGGGSMYCYELWANINYVGLW